MSDKSAFDNPLWIDKIIPESTYQPKRPVIGMAITNKYKDK